MMERRAVLPSRVSQFKSQAAREGCRRSIMLTYLDARKFSVYDGETFIYQGDIIAIPP